MRQIDDAQPAGAGVLCRDPQPVEALDRLLESRLVERGRRRQQVEGRRPVEDRQQVGQQPGVIGETRQALHDGAAEAGRQADGFERAPLGDPGPPCAPQRPGLCERLHELFEVERISCRLIREDARQPFRPDIERHHRGDEVGDLLAIERVERHAPDTRRAGEPVQRLEGRAGPVGVVAQAADEQPRPGVRPLHQVLDEVGPGRVAPLQVFEEDDAARAGGETRQQFGHRVQEFLAADFFLIGRRHRRRGGLRGRRRRRQIRLPGELPEDFDERLERDAAVLVAAAGEVRDAGELQPVLHLAQQPALADAARPADEDQTRQGASVSRRPGFRAGHRPGLRGLLDVRDHQVEQL